MPAAHLTLIGAHHRLVSQCAAAPLAPVRRLKVRHLYHTFVAMNFSGSRATDREASIVDGSGGCVEVATAAVPASS